MLQVKKVTLRLIETFVDKCEDTAMISAQFVPAMMDPVLGDYARNVPDARYACASYLCWNHIETHQRLCLFCLSWQDRA